MGFSEIIKILLNTLPALLECFQSMNQRDQRIMIRALRNPATQKAALTFAATIDPEVQKILDEIEKT